MTKYDLIATSAFGLEAVVGQELKYFGFEDLKIENSRVNFKGDLRDIAFCNLNIRTSDRILIKIAEFPVETFDELFDNTKNIKWSEYFAKDAAITVSGKSVKSILYSTPDCQAIVKKAIIESLRNDYNTDYFPETGSFFKVEISILKDVAILTIDTSGPGLHKRGYRQLAGEAPLKETLACAILMLSRWDKSRPLADLFCGSGTIAIEAAMMAQNIAPGLHRSFTSEKWEWFDQKIWQEEREKAKALETDDDIVIYASDIDRNMIELAKDNARQAGVEKYINFKAQHAAKFAPEEDYGCVISNPPYGERLGEKDMVRKLYMDMGDLSDKLKTWSFFTLTANQDFERLFGKRADKNRKLFNGNIQCYLYQHFGPLPRVENFY